MKTQEDKIKEQKKSKFQKEIESNAKRLNEIYDYVFQQGISSERERCLKEIDECSIPFSEDYQEIGKWINSQGEDNFRIVNFKKFKSKINSPDETKVNPSSVTKSDNQGTRGLDKKPITSSPTANDTISLDTQSSKINSEETKNAL